MININIHNKIADNINNICKEKNISYEELSANSEISEKRIRKLCTTSKKRRFLCSEVYAIANALNVDIKMLLKDK